MIGPADVIRCDACGEVRTPFEFGPMLHDHIWQQITEFGERTLCAKYGPAHHQAVWAQHRHRASVALGCARQRAGRIPAFAGAGLSRRRWSRHRSARTDANGVTTLHDRAGRVTGTARTDSNGVTTFHDASGRGMTLMELVAAIDGDRQHAHLSSAIRLFVLGVYRDQLASSKTNRFGLQAIGT